MPLCTDYVIIDYFYIVKSTELLWGFMTINKFLVLFIIIYNQAKTIRKYGKIHKTLSLIWKKFDHHYTVSRH